MRPNPARERTYTGKALGPRSARGLCCASRPMHLASGARSAQTFGDEDHPTTRPFQHIMPLLGSSAMLLSFDITPEAVQEHDRWHTHEHLPERLAIPGFLRGTRWVATEGEPRYMVLYEVSNLEVLASEAYLARLNNPTPWTTKMMQHYRGMRRGLCVVVGSFGLGQGGLAALLRFAPAPSRAKELQQWLLQDALPRVQELPGLGSAHVLQGAQPAAMTNEQRIRGADRSVDFAIIITGYDREAVAAVAKSLVGAGGLPDHGAVEVEHALYRTGYSLAAAEVDA